MRLLVSKSIYAKKGPPGANQGIIYHQVQMWPWCLHPSGTLTFPPLSPQAEPISKGHCWKWQNEAEHMETLGRKGLNAIACMCLWCHFQQFPWEIGSVWAERVGQRRWFGTPKRWIQHGFVWTWLSIFLSRAISPILSTNGPRKTS